MSDYRPGLPFTTEAYVLAPEYATIKGVKTKTGYPEPGEQNVFFCSFKTYGGTENTKNDILVVEDTAIVETWYRPDIQADCRIRLSDGTEYEIINKPENINRRNQFMRFKVRCLEGNA